MKKIILVLGIIMFSVFQVSHSKADVNISNPSSLNGMYGIEDGWYTATVNYYNSSTYTNSTYTLNVKVDYNSVSAIDFGNGGSVHSGYNNEGYMYYGGSLYFETDYDGNTTAATTTVSISDENGTRTFQIRIE